MVSTGQRTCLPWYLGLASVVVNADKDAREVELSSVDTHEQRGALVVGAALTMAKGTAGVGPAGRD